jgi:hypothetical protein
MTSEDKKASLATRFAERVPSSQGDVDVSLEVDSLTMFAPLEGGDLLARLALTSDETFDLAINPVCALRLAATILDQLHKSGDYVVELSIYDGASGNQVARIRP